MVGSHPSVRYSPYFVRYSLGSSFRSRPKTCMPFPLNSIAMRNTTRWHTTLPPPLQEYNIGHRTVLFYSRDTSTADGEAGTRVFKKGSPRDYETQSGSCWVLTGLFSAPNFSSTRRGSLKHNVGASVHFTIKMSLMSSNEACTCQQHRTLISPVETDCLGRLQLL